MKLVDIEDNLKIIILNGHTRGVRKATWHPSGSLLTTSGSDGRIIVWDVSEDQAKQEKTIDGVIPPVPDNEYDCLLLSFSLLIRAADLQNLCTMPRHFGTPLDSIFLLQLAPTKL